MFYGVLIILFGMLWQSMSPDNYIVNKPYNHFTQNLDDVSSFLLRSDQKTFGYILRGDTTLYQSVFPPGKVTLLIDELQTQGTIIEVEAPPEPAGFGSMILFSIIPVMLLIGALVWMSKRGGSSGVAAFGNSPATLVDPAKNTTTLADVAGNPGDFDEVYELIDFLKAPEKYWRAGATLPHGILLYGPPGTGKTLLARAIAGEAKVPFYTISGSDFVEMFVGVGASRVRNMFETLKKAAPAILFIDEIDAVGGQRSGGFGGAGNREADQTLNQLLVEMDGFDEHASIMVIGATNRPDSLDPALLRPGRFDRIIPIHLPDINARKKILEVHVKGRDVEDDIDLHTIAKGTPGFSGADLMNLVNEAAMLVAKGDRESMTMADLDGARDRVLMGKEKSLVMDDKEKEMTAFHEAGHAIAGFNMPEHDPIYKISIVPRGQALGVTMYLPERDRYSHSHQYLQSQLVSLMGGRAAEELQYGKLAITTGASNDLQRATELARSMITKWGFSDTGLISFPERDFDLISDDTKTKIDDQVRALLDAAYKQALAILTKNKSKLKKVASALVEKETIDLEEFLILIGKKRA